MLKATRQLNKRYLAMNENGTPPLRSLGHQRARCKWKRNTSCICFEILDKPMNGQRVEREHPSRDEQVALYDIA
jgi:hypothetical protein